MCKINGKELREMRIKAGMTQKELAKLIDVSEASIGFYENGRTNPTDDTVRKIGILFNVNPKDLELSDEEVIQRKVQEIEEQECLKDNLLEKF